MEVIYSLFICDANHTHQSKELLGCFDNLIDLSTYIHQYSIDSEEGELGSDDWSNLSAFKQTQCRCENYIVEENEINPSYVTN